PRVAAIHAHAGDHVGAALFELRDHRRNVGGIVLQIGVERDDEFPLRRVPRGIERSGLACVLREREDAQHRIARALLAQHGETAIGRAVVDGDDLVRPAASLQRRRDLAQQEGNVLFLVVHGKDDGQIRLIHDEGSLTEKACSKFEVVCSATRSSGTFHKVASSSATLTTYAGSLSRPRNGTGARYGVSVSMSTRSCGSARATSRSDSALRNVTMPEK